MWRHLQAATQFCRNNTNSSVYQWCSWDRNLRDWDRDMAQISRRDRDRDFVIKAETETEIWKFEAETETRDLKFLRL